MAMMDGWIYSPCCKDKLAVAQYVGEPLYVCQSCGRKFVVVEREEHEHKVPQEWFA